MLVICVHHLALKAPNATNSLCGYKSVTDQPSDRLGEDFSDQYKDFSEQLNCAEDLSDNVLLLLDNLGRDLQYAVIVEGKMDLETVSNYDEVKNAIREKVLGKTRNPNMAELCNKVKGFKDQTSFQICHVERELGCGLEFACLLATKPSRRISYLNASRHPFLCGPRWRVDPTMDMIRWSLGSTAV